jgi:hypothetical protein
MEESIFADYAFVKVHKADRMGNCQFRKAQNNFNEAMGKNAKITLVETDHIVEVGEIAPEDIHLQGIYVSKVIKSTEGKQIEKTTFRKNPEELQAAGKCHMCEVHPQFTNFAGKWVEVLQAGNELSNEQPENSKMVCMSTWELVCHLPRLHL